MARRIHPGQRNSLDALCRRYQIDNSHRELHGALLDAEILSDVFLALTGGQASLSLDSHTDQHGNRQQSIRRLAEGRPPLKVIAATEEELQAHTQRLQAIDKASGGMSVWRQLEGVAPDSAGNS
jgi:DNA polymerase-3 subunit epsilon